MARHLDKEKRDRIINAALEAFGDHGFGNTSMKLIAERAGLAAGTIYTYFSDKAALFETAVEETWQEFMDELSRIGDRAEEFDQAFDQILDVGLRLLRRIQPILRGMYSEANRRLFWTDQLDHLVSVLDEVLVVGVRQGRIRLPEDVEVRRFYEKVVISGILSVSAQTPSSDLDGEFSRMRRLVRRAFLAGPTTEGE